MGKIRFVVITKANLECVYNPLLWINTKKRVFGIDLNELESDEGLREAGYEMLAPRIEVGGKEMKDLVAPAFRLGEILIVEEYGEGYFWTLPTLVKLHKWPVEYEIFDRVEEAIERAKRLRGLG